MTKITLTIIALITFLAMFKVASADTIDLKKCIGALNAFESSIKKGESSIDPYWIRGKIGQLLMNNQAPFYELRNHLGNTKDISYCVGTELTVEEIDLFLLSYYGYLPLPHLEGLSQCYAVMLEAAPEMEKKLGRERSFSIGMFIGEHIGRTFVQLNYLYKTQETALEAVSIRGEKIHASFSGMSPATKTKFIKSGLSMCAWYNIPLEGTLKGAGVAIK